MAQQLTNPTSIPEDMSSIPGLAQWVKYLVLPWCCGVGCRRGLDLALLWLWCSLVASAPIRPLAWEPPCAAEHGLKKTRGKKKKKVNIRKSSNCIDENKIVSKGNIFIGPSLGTVFVF